MKIVLANFLIKISIKRCIALFLFALGFFPSTNAKAQTNIDTIGNTIVHISVAVDSSHFQGGYSSGPWDLYWGPDQKLWYTNAKNLCTYDPVTHIIDTILTIPYGFMMGVTADRNFFTNPYVYICIDTSSYYGGGNIIQVFRYDYSLAGDSLYNPLYLLQWRHGGEHSGGRIIHGADDKLYISTAEYFISADTLFSNSGKVLRVNTDGSVPIDNPRPDYTYSFGHRNPQGIVQVPNGNIFVSEYGMQWDELNLIQRNQYYGWIVFDGIQCIGNVDTCNYYDSLTTFPLDVGLNPPSGIDYYNQWAIPAFNGLIQAVTGAIKQGIIAYTMNAAYDSVIAKNYYLTQKYGRVRDVCSAPNGSVYFIARDRLQADIRMIQNPLFSELKYQEDENLFSFYPNPVSKELFLKLKSDEPTDIFIRDLSGKIIYTRQISGGSGMISIESIPAGCYFISVRSKLIREIYKKMIVVKK